MNRNIRKLWLILVIVGFCLFPLHETIAADCTETFSWFPNPESNIESYKIYYDQTDGGPYPNMVDVGNPAPVDGRIQGTVPGLTCGQQYYFVCTAVDDTGSESAYSNQIELTAGEVPDDEIEPETVTGLQSTTHSIGECSSNPEIAVQWTAAVDTGGSGLDGYSIVWDTESDTLPDTTKDIEDVTTVTSSSLSDGSYYFHIRSVDNALNWSDTAEHLGPFCIDSAVPIDPMVLGAIPGDGQVALSWTNPTNVDFVGTMIRYRTDGIYPTNYSEGIEVCNKTTPPCASDTYTLTGLSNGTTYYFSAFTYDKDGNYSKAAHISAMPSADANTITFGDISGSDFSGTCQDTYLNTNEINYSDDSESIRTYTWPANTVANRIPMKWDLSALPQDAIIQEATLSLYMYSFEKTGDDDNYEITAHKIINHNPYISFCTWNTYDGSNSWTGGANGGEQDIASAESSTIVDKTSGYKNWDITQMVREWVKNPSTNLGLMLNSDTTAASDSNRYFRPTEYSIQDQRPVLTIKCYGSDISEVPSVPTGLGVKVGD